MSNSRSSRSITTVTVFRLAALFTVLAVAMGAMVCATGSGASCPTWPGCLPDQIAPGWELNPVIEFTHRVVAISAGPLVLLAAVMSAFLKDVHRAVRILPWIALMGAIAAGAFGRLVVLSSLPTWLGAVDLFCALTAMTAMAFAAILVTDRPSDAHTAPRDSRVDQVSALGAASIIVLIAMHVTGIFAAGVLSFTRCMGWPMWQFIESDLHPWLQAVRLGLAGLGAVLVILTVLSALRTELLRRWGIVVAVLFLAEMMLGLLIRTGGLTSSSAAMYSVLAVALLWFLALTTAVAVRDRVRTPRTDSSPVPSEPGLSTPA